MLKSAVGALACIKAWSVTLRQQERGTVTMIRKAQEPKGEEVRALSRLQQPIPDPPSPGRAVVWGWNTEELKPRFMHFLIMSNMLALQGLQGEHPL